MGEALSILGHIYYANSDLSGFSIFEAQSRGVTAADRALHDLR
jgi:hypothetical protein